MNQWLIDDGWAFFWLFEMIEYNVIAVREDEFDEYIYMTTPISQ